MPIQVLDFELTEPAKPIWVAEKHDAVCLLVRFHGKPIGWVYLTDTGEGSILPETILRSIGDQIGWSCLEAVLGEGSSFKDRPSGSLPPISVIVCQGDEPTAISRCLSSLEDSRYSGYEIILVSHGKHDFSLKYQKSHPQVRYCWADHSNLAIARNRGIAEARHDIVAFIDPEGYPDSQWLTTVGQAFSSQSIDGLCGLVVSDGLRTDSQVQFEHGGYGLGRGLERRLYRKTTLNDWAVLRAQGFGSGHNMAFKRSVIQAIGGFDPRFDVNLPSGASDVEFFHRFIVRGYRLLYEPQAITWHSGPKDKISLHKGAYLYGKGTGIYLFMCLRKRTVGRQALLRHVAYDWAWQRIGRRFIRPGKATRLLVLRELLGAIVSPLAFLRARKRFRAQVVAQKALTCNSASRTPVQLPESVRVERSHRSLDHRLAKRIKVVRTCYPHWGQFSGINQYLRYLNPRKFRIDTLMVQESDAQFPLKSEVCRDWLRYWARKNDMAWYNLSDLQAELSILRACLFERPHLIHYMDGEHAAQWMPRITHLPPGIRPRFVASYHQPPDVMEAVIRKDIIAFFDRVIAVAPEQADYLRSMTAPEKVALILHGVNTEFFRPPCTKPERDIVRCISVGYNYRDYRALREIASRHKDNKNLEFHIVSGKVTGCETLPNVVMHKDVNDLKLLELYQDADILFLPLYKATANNSLLEGIACGLPVISTYLPAVKTYLPGHEALLIDADKVDDYTDALALLSKDRSLRERMGELARKRAEELAWDKVCAQYEKIYSELLLQD